MLQLGGVAMDEASGRSQIERALSDGSALGRFRRCAALQGGTWPADFAKLRAPEHAQVKATRAGYVSAIDTEQVGRAGVVLGGGRARKEDPVDPAQWIRIEKKRGERVAAGDVLCRYSRPSSTHATRVGQTPEQIAADAEHRLAASFIIADHAPPARPLVLEVIR
jgi:thymidine phosphorylase